MRIRTLIERLTNKAALERDVIKRQLYEAMIVELKNHLEREFIYLFAVNGNSAVVIAANANRAMFLLTERYPAVALLETPPAAKLIGEAGIDMDEGVIE
jgi:hypothetical protein